MASDIARLLRKQYLDLLSKEDNSPSSDPIFARFKAIGDQLKAKSTALTDHESISRLSFLNDALTQWRTLKDQNKPIKKIFCCHDQVTHMNDRSMTEKLDEIKELVLSASSSQLDLLELDGYTFYKADRITCTEDEVSDELEKRIVGWLLTSPFGDGFKAVGICGMGWSGKTALVKNVLKQKTVVDKFKNIIWACLSELTSEEEIDAWIIKYLLYRLGLDTDVLVDKMDEDKDWLMEELVRQLGKSGNYILVLDDMWHCSKWFAEVLLGKLKKNGGGAVIVTSRKKTVAEKIGDKNKLIHLGPTDSVYKESFFFKKDSVN